MMCCMLCSTTRYGGSLLFSMKRLGCLLMSSCNLSSSFYLHIIDKVNAYIPIIIPIIIDQMSINMNLMHMFAVHFCLVNYHEIDDTFTFFSLNNKSFAILHEIILLGSAIVDDILVSKVCTCEDYLACVKGHHFIQ